MDNVGGLIFEDAASGFESRLLDQGDMAGVFASMSVTDVGVVQIAYQNSLYENLRFSSDETGEWATEEVDDTPRSGEQLAICSDRNGDPHIAYVVNEKNVEGPPKLVYTYKKDGKWHYEEVVTDGEYTKLQYLSTAIGSDDSVFILYREWFEWGNGFRSTIKSAVRDTGRAWTFEKIYQIDGQAGDYLTMALDENDNPHAAFSDYANQEIKVAVRTGKNDWVIETAVELEGSAKGVSIDLDRLGKAYVSYLTETAEGAELVLATNKSGAWESQLLDELQAFNVVGSTSIALDREGAVHISYIDAEVLISSVRYITNKNGEWSKMRVDSGDFVGEYNSLKVDTHDMVHIAYSGDFALWHARFPAGKTDAVLAAP